MTQAIHRATAFSDAISSTVRPAAISFAVDDGTNSDAVRSTASAAPRRHLLLLQFALYNLAAFALLGAAYIQGWVGTVINADGTGLSSVIFAVFLAGFAISARKIWKISCELDCVRRFDPCRRSWATEYLAEVSGRRAGSRAITGSTLRIKVANHIIVVRHVANSLVLLGLIGTVLGFIIALSGINPDVAGDVSAIAPMLTHLIGGMSVALYTTLVGAVFNLWLSVNYHILAGGALKLVGDLVSLGEANARHTIV